PASPSADLTAATIEPGEPTHDCFTGTLAGSAWYAFTPATSGIYGFDIQGGHAGVVTVFSGSSLGGLTPLACITSTVGHFSGGEWRADAGTTYYIQLGGTSPTGLVLFGPFLPQTITFNSTPPNPALFGGTYTPSASGGGSG